MNAVNAWLKRKKEADEVIRIVEEHHVHGADYLLLPAYKSPAGSLGRILFDQNGYWIYDGNDLLVEEQEQLADFIQQHFYLSIP